MYISEQPVIKGQQPLIDLSAFRTYEPWLLSYMWKYFNTNQGRKCQIPDCFSHPSTYIHMYFNVIEAVLHFLAGVPVSLLFCSTLICSFFMKLPVLFY